jgi:hypothetical protein
MTLRRLHIRINYGCFLEHLIERVPVLEKLCVYSVSSLQSWQKAESAIDVLIEPNGNWFDKVR